MAVKKKNETNEIMVVEETAISTVNVDQALQEWEAYQTITEKMLDDTDYQQIQGRAFKKKSAWRKYARAFNITTELKLLSLSVLLCLLVVMLMVGETVPDKRVIRLILIMIFLLLL